jgi:Tol biopolymer transport system component
VFERETADDDWDILSFDPSTREVAKVVATPASEYRPRVSRDGRWLAYVSEESGRAEAYVRPLGPYGSRQRVSTEGASAIGWAPDGRTLYYSNIADRTMWAARVTMTPALTVAPPARLLSMESYNIGSWDISPDGTRFVMVKRGPRPPTDRLELVTNALRVDAGSVP